MSWGYLQSPNRHFVLDTIEGDPDTIEAAGRHYTTVGDRMEWTADELEKLGNSEKYRADSLDKIRESARDVFGDLRKVAKRYSKTGPVLVTYAGALRTAQNRTVDPLVDDIRAAHTAAEEAEREQRAAQSVVDDYGTTHFWESEASDADKRSANRALTAANTAATTAAADLEGLWTTFESGYADWEDAYETAVAGVADAIDSSGINDSWWEDALDTLANIATVVGTIAVIAALVIGGPITLLVATIASVVALAAHLTMMLAGSKRVSLTDLAFDALGVVPFLGGVAKGLKGLRGLQMLRGVPGAMRSAAGFGTAGRSALQAGRNAVALDLRSITSAGRSIGNRAAREAMAPGVADDFLRGVQGSWARNTWNALRTGGAKLDGQVATFAERMAADWPAAGRMSHRSANWIAQNVAGGPGVAMQGLNIWNTGYGAYQSSQVAGVPFPDMPDMVGGLVDAVRGR